MTSTASTSTRAMDGRRPLKLGDSCRVWIGTSGYSFADWVGAFYPPHTSSSEMLAFYTTKFDTVELNYTFYYMPTQKISEAMVKNTPRGFQFFVKANQILTHHRELSAADIFIRGIEPIKDSGKLAGLLFQFPQSFKNTERHRRYLNEIGKRFADYAVAVEFRDRSWASYPIYKYLECNGLSLVAVDEPSIGTLFPRVGVATSQLGYLRFHSRDGDKWYKAGADRYDYLYAEDELREWLPLLQTISNRASDIFVYFNNCHRGQAAENALAMKDLLIREAPSLF